MNKKLLGVISAVAVALLVLAGCGSNTAGSVKQTATRTYDVDGTRVVVQVDVSDGYSVEFASGAVYLYEGENSDENSACAFGYLTSQEEYETIIAENEGSEGYSEVGGGVIYKTDISDNYAYYVGEDQYFMVSVQNDSGVDPDSVYARFNVSIDE